MILKFTYNEIGSVVQKLFSYCNGKEGKFVLEIRKSKNIRSLNQNRFYWGVVIPILSDHFGYIHEEMHQICASMFLSYKKENTDTTVCTWEFTKSTAKLNTAEFENYIEQIRIWAHTNNGIHIPLPNEVTEEMYIELQRKYNQV